MSNLPVIGNLLSHCITFFNGKMANCHIWIRVTTLFHCQIDCNGNLSNKSISSGEADFSPWARYGAITKDRVSKTCICKASAGFWHDLPRLFESQKRVLHHSQKYNDHPSPGTHQPPPHSLVCFRTSKKRTSASVSLAFSGTCHIRMFVHQHVRENVSSHVNEWFETWRFGEHPI